MIDRAQNHELVRVLRGLGKDLADLDTGDVGLDRGEGAPHLRGSLGFGVEGIQLTGPPTRKSMMQLTSLSGARPRAAGLGQRQTEAAAAPA